MLLEASPWLALALLAPLLACAGADAQRRGWALVALATLALFLALRTLPQFVPGPRIIGDHWDWTGPLAGLAGVLALLALLVRRGLLRWRDAGFTLAQAPGSLTISLLVAAAALSVNYAAMSLSAFRLPAVPLETWLYQATLPGLVEESLFRGALLALAERALGPRSARWNVLGAPIGWGGLLTTLAFLALHGVSVFTALGVLPAALLYLWLRARTGSLLLPILVHNLWNLGVHAAHL